PDAFLVQAGGKRKRVVAADRNQIVNAQPIQIFDDFGGEIVLVLIVGCAQRLRYLFFFQCWRVRTRGMQKRAASACCTIDDLFCKDLKVLAVVGVFITQDADRAQPAMADTNDLIAFAQGANGARADRGIEPRHIPTAGENTDYAFLAAHANIRVWSRDQSTTLFLRRHRSALTFQKNSGKE